MIFYAAVSLYRAARAEWTRTKKNIQIFIGLAMVFSFDCWSFTRRIRGTHTVVHWCNYCVFFSRLKCHKNYANIHVEKSAYTNQSFTKKIKKNDGRTHWQSWVRCMFLMNFLNGNKNYHAFVWAGQGQLFFFPVWVKPQSTMQVLTCVLFCEKLRFNCNENFTV